MGLHPEELTARELGAGIAITDGTRSLESSAHLEAKDGVFNSSSAPSS
jgi:hypothetical protein